MVRLTKKKRGIKKTNKKSKTVNKKTILRKKKKRGGTDTECSLSDFDNTIFEPIVSEPMLSHFRSVFDKYTRNDFSYFNRSEYRVLNKEFMTGYENIQPAKEFYNIYLEAMNKTNEIDKNHEYTEDDIFRSSLIVGIFVTYFDLPFRTFVEETRQLSGVDMNKCAFFGKYYLITIMMVNQIVDTNHDIMKLVDTFIKNNRFPSMIKMAGTNSKKVIKMFENLNYGILKY